MHDEELWLEPDYFEDFHCKCGDCRNCCCDGWDIAVSRDEYFRLIGMECSEELHHRLECSFRVPDQASPERFRVISSNWLGECPMRDADGLCMLQKECGEEALPRVCHIYPRSLKKEGELLQACCSNGCEAVVEALLSKERLHFRFARLQAQPELTEAVDAKLLMMGRICMERIQERSLPLRRRLLEVQRLVCERDGEIPSAEDGLKAFEDVLPVLERASLTPYRDAVFSLCGDAEKYAEGAGRFEAAFPDWERWMENLLINHMIYMSFPLVDARMSYSEALKGLCGTWSLLRMVCIASTSKHASTEHFVDAAASVFRLVEHSSFYYNSHVLLKNEIALLAL